MGQQPPIVGEEQTRPALEVLHKRYAFRPEQRSLERLFEQLSTTYPNLKKLKPVPAHTTSQKIDYLKGLAKQHGIVIVEGSAHTKVVGDTIYIRGKLTSEEDYLAHLTHEMAHILTNSKGETIPTFLEMYFVGKAVDRETDLQIVLPLVLPFLERLEDSNYTGGSYGFYTIRDPSNASQMMYLILKTIGSPDAYRCNGSRGERCIRQIADRLGEAYQVSRQLVEGEKLLQIFDSIAVELLHPLYPKARP